MASRQATIISMVMVFMLIFKINHADGHTYYVGGDRGWNNKISNWPNGKTFHSGDILVFKYNPEVHSVMRVNADDYHFCRVNTVHSEVHETGNDHIKLRKGYNYFFCGVSSNCKNGMKMVVNAI